MTDLQTIQKKATFLSSLSQASMNIRRNVHKSPETDDGATVLRRSSATSRPENAYSSQDNSPFPNIKFVLPKSNPRRLDLRIKPRLTKTENLLSHRDLTSTLRVCDPTKTRLSIL